MRTYRLWLSPRSALLSLLVIAAVVATMASAPFAGMYLFTATAMLFPFMLQIILTTAGLLPAHGGLSMIGYGLYHVFGISGALFGVSYLLPLTLLMTGCLQARLHYRRTMMVLTLGYAVLVTLLYLLARKQLGGDPFTELTRQAIASLDAMADRDSFLNTFYRFGMLALPAELAADPLVEAAQGWTFSPAVLQEFYKQATTRIDLWLRAMLPTLISSYSIQWGVAGLFVAMHFGRRQAQRIAYFSQDDTKAEDVLPDIGMPAFSQWHIPKELAVLLYGFLGLWLVIRLLQAESLMLPAQMMYHTAAALFSIQGLSFVNHWQKKRDTSPRLRGLTLVLLLVVLSQAALMLGVFDQFADPRKLRAEQSDPEERNGRDQG